MTVHVQLSAAQGTLARSTCENSTLRIPASHFHSVSGVGENVYQERVRRSLPFSVSLTLTKLTVEPRGSLMQECEKSGRLVIA